MNPYLNIDLGIPKLTSLYRLAIMQSDVWPETAPMSDNLPVLSAAVKDDLAWKQDHRNYMGRPVYQGTVELLMDGEPAHCELTQTKILTNERGIIKYKNIYNKHIKCLNKNWWIRIWNECMVTGTLEEELTDHWQEIEVPDPPDDLLWPILIHSWDKEHTTLPASEPLTISVELAKIGGLVNVAEILSAVSAGVGNVIKFGYAMLDGQQKIAVFGIQGLAFKIFSEPKEAVEAVVAEAEAADKKFIVDGKILNKTDFKQIILGKMADWHKHLPSMAPLSPLRF